MRARLIKKRIMHYSFILLFLAAGCALKPPPLQDQRMNQPFLSETASLVDEKAEGKNITGEGSDPDSLNTPSFNKKKNQVKKEELTSEIYHDQGIYPDSKAAFPPVEFPVISAKRTDESYPPVGYKVVSRDYDQQLPSLKNGDDEIAFNFDDADIYEVIRIMADSLNINYVVDPKVSGRVTIHTSGKIKQKDLLPIFYHILEVNGLTAVNYRGLLKIVKLKEAPSRLALSGIKQGDTPMEGVIIQIIQLKYISAEEMANLLKPFISSDGIVLSHESSNSLVLVDTVYNVRKALELTQNFDVDSFGRFHYRFYPLMYMDAAEMETILNTVFFKSVVGKDVTHTTFLGIERLNYLLVISSNLRVFERVDEFLKQIDVSSETGASRIYVYSVRNGQAEQLADLLNQVFSDESTAQDIGEVKKDKKKIEPRNPLARSSDKSKKNGKKGIAKAAVAALDSGVLRDKVRIVPDLVRNALIIEARPTDYMIIQSVLNKIDIMPRQVLIEVKIAEVTLDDSTKLGVEWSYLKGGGTPSTSLLSAAINTSEIPKIVDAAGDIITPAIPGIAGLQYVIGEAGRWRQVLSALASENKVDMLSSPSILASDNTEATIDISGEIPVASAEYQYTSQNEPLLEKKIQYRDTGVILSVTPHINERGLVTMVIALEVSNVSKPVDVGGKEYPAFFKRDVKSTLTTKHGQTIVIGGLISKEKSDGRSGVPWLSQMPVIGFFFGQDTSSVEKKELIILITPHVITNLEDVDEVTHEFKNKVGRVIDLFLKE